MLNFKFFLCIYFIIKISKFCYFFLKTFKKILLKVLKEKIHLVNKSLLIFKEKNLVCKFFFKIINLIIDFSNKNLLNLKGFVRKEKTFQIVFLLSSQNFSLSVKIVTSNYFYIILFFFL